MEDEEITLDHEGHVDLRYRGWAELESDTITLLTSPKSPFFGQLMSLDLSFNNLCNLPDEICDIKKMTYFNCACNALKSIPSAIGRLRRLKEFKANGNRLKTLPREIGECKSLSILNLSENRLESLPESLGDCMNLQTIKLENNNLHSLPLTLAKVMRRDGVSMAVEIEMNVENNPHLSIIPNNSMKGNSTVIMWIICFLYEKTTLVHNIRTATMDMSSMVKKIESTVIPDMRSRMEELEREKAEFIAERKYAKHFIVVREWFRLGVQKTSELVSFCKKMMVRENRVDIVL